jgi:S1-C subfamily serine protease
MTEGGLPARRCRRIDRDGRCVDKAYLKVQDVICEFGGAPIGSADALRSAVAAAPAGQQILIKFHRTQYERGVYAQF